MSAVKMQSTPRVLRNISIAFVLILNCSFEVVDGLMSRRFRRLLLIIENPLGFTNLPEYASHAFLSLLLWIKKPPAILPLGQRGRVGFSTLAQASL